MPKNHRYIPEPGTLVEVTNRTIQSRFLLRPGPDLNEIAVGALARAQERYNAEVHFFIMLSNHYHLLATVDSAQQLARFIGYFQSKLAKEVCRLYGWKDKVWAREYDVTVLHAANDIEAERVQVARLRYLIENSCKEGLVASPLDWPGVNTARALIKGRRRIRGVWINRTKQWFANQKRKRSPERDFREMQTLELTPLPCWQHLSDARHTREIRRIVRQVERSTEVRHLERGTSPLGPHQVLDQNPLGQPFESKRSPSILVHAGSRASRGAFRRAYARFVDACRTATDRFRETGDLSGFPTGAFLPSLPLAEVRFD